MPNALLEAMACGVACVVTRIEGITENIIESGYNGLVVDQGDHAVLADAILAILRNPELMIHVGLNAAKTVEDKFRIDKIAERYYELYRDLVNKGSCDKRS